MNLIHDPWIPVRRRDGSKAVIAPWQVTEGAGEEILELAAPRPDFNGALIQFLIGLVQTTFAPKNPREWRQRLKEPPKPEDLKAAFDAVAQAFNLDGDGPRFMQEVGLKRNAKGEIHPINYLLIDAPTDNTIKMNRDLFIKRPAVNTEGFSVKFCIPCSASTVYTMQTFAPSGGGGGDGKFTGLRGGGPLSTVIVGTTLWQTVWLNVVEQSYFNTSNKYSIEHTFPWLAPEKFIKKSTGKSISSEDMNSLHVFWGMPRRIYLEIEEGAVEMQCALCGNTENKFVTKYKDTTSGLSYFAGEGNKKKASWIAPLHPLTPYSRDMQGKPSAFHAKSGGIGYRHWLGIVLLDASTNLTPAAVIDALPQKRFENTVRLWAYGYEMDKMTARAWHDSMMPLLFVDENHVKDYETHIGIMILAAQSISGALILACLRANYFIPSLDKDKNITWKIPKSMDRYQNKNENNAEDAAISEEKALTETIRTRFWQTTESEFFSLLQKLRDTLTSEADIQLIMAEWHRTLARTAETIFNDLSQTGMFEAADPKRIALAWRGLRLALHSGKLKEQLGIPVDQHRQNKAQ